MPTLRRSCVPFCLLLGASLTPVQAAAPIRLVAAVSTPSTASLSSAIPRASSEPGGSGFLEGTLWATVAHRYGLEARLLYGVALKETRHRAGFRTSTPWPYTLRGPDGPQFHRTRSAAAQALQRLTARHPPLAIDVGLMQVNLHWHGRRVADPAQLLDARTNLEIAAAILAQAIHSAPGDLELGIGRYHHWKDARRARAYGRHVLRLARALAAGG
jgi:hypothetical protein